MGSWASTWRRTGCATSPRAYYQRGQFGFWAAGNLGSRRVMEKAGLRYIRTLHQDWPERIPGDEHGDVEYALTRAECQAAHR
jgi:hypothetical protein